MTSLAGGLSSRTPLALDVADRGERDDGAGDVEAVEDADDGGEVLVREPRLLGDAGARGGADDDPPLLHRPDKALAADPPLGLGPRHRPPRAVGGGAPALFH